MRLSGLPLFNDVFKSWTEDADVCRCCLGSFPSAVLMIFVKAGARLQEETGVPAAISAEPQHVFCLAEDKNLY